MAQLALTPTTASTEAVRLVDALADSLPRSQRFLFLCGPPGVGKSELLRVTVRRFRARKPAATIVESHGEGLVDSLIEAVLRDALYEFRRRFTGADLIAIDDLHTLRGKARTQTEVAALFQTALDRGARIVCAAGSPNEVPVLAAAIRGWANTRIVRIPPVGVRDARRVLTALAQTHDLALADATLAELASRSRGDLRRGVGALARLRLQQDVRAGNRKSPSLDPQDPALDLGHSELVRTEARRQKRR